MDTPATWRDFELFVNQLREGGEPPATEPWDDLLQRLAMTVRVSIKMVAEKSVGIKLKPTRPDLTRIVNEDGSYREGWDEPLLRQDLGALGNGISAFAIHGWAGEVPERWVGWFVYAIALLHRSPGVAFFGGQLAEEIRENFKPQEVMKRGDLAQVLECLIAVANREHIESRFVAWGALIALRIWLLVAPLKARPEAVMADIA